MATPADLGSASIEEVRLSKRAELMASGRDPYPVSCQPTHTIEAIRFRHDGLQPDVITDELVTVAGRVMFFRTGGKIAFVTLQAGSGARLQLLIPADAIGAHAIVEGLAIPPVPEGQGAGDPVSAGKALIKEFGRLVDIGDFITATGYVCTSIKGELSIRTHAWAMASKGIRALPFLHADLSDETRVRQPYLELIQSQEARDRVRARSKIVRVVRSVFEDQDYIEVETPILQPIHGGAQARPFTTHVNAIDQDFSLRIAMELPLKKMIVAGLERVYEIGKVFRNEGSDTSHSPEFTMLECYASYSDMHGMAQLVQSLFLRIATSFGDSGLILEDDTTLNFAGEWAWLSVYDGVSAATGVPVSPDSSAEELRLLCDEHSLSYDPAWTAGKLVMELCSDLVEPRLIQPTFLHDWPAEAQPLARRNPEDPRRILAWDLIINGMELGCAFTELIDPVVQREILTEQSLRAANGDAEAMQLDEDFLNALALGMPPTGGMGLGIDRLVMLFTQASIREVILFPLVRRLD